MLAGREIVPQDVKLRLPRNRQKLEGTTAHMTLDNPKKTDEFHKAAELHFFPPGDRRP